MLNIYQFISYFSIPVIICNLILRLIYKKEDNKRYFERFGVSKIKLENSKKTIWLHAASVGEFKSSDLIISKYHKKFNLLVTTTTKSSAEYIDKFYSDKVLHQYIPYDVPFWCSRFVSFWKPNLVLWIESDIWPNILKEIRNKKINCLYINARISPKSFERWRYFRNIYFSSLMTFNKIFAQSRDDLERIKKLTDMNIQFIGNLKLSKSKANKISIKTKNNLSIMIASSHENEEIMIIESLKEIIQKNKIKLLIAPRHPNRAVKILEVCRKYNYISCLDSKITNQNYEVVIIDSFGKLEKYFEKSDIVILGGSFVKKGGHNPLEPASHGCVIISGSHVYNWQNIFNEMSEEKACILVKDLKELNLKISDLIYHKPFVEKYKKKALDFSNKNFFDNKALFNEIDTVLE